MSLDFKYSLKRDGSNIRYYFCFCILMLSKVKMYIYLFLIINILKINKHIRIIFSFNQKFTDFYYFLWMLFLLESSNYFLLQIFCFLYLHYLFITK